jgi:hypothetical protein
VANLKIRSLQRENFKQASGTVVASCYIATYEGFTVVHLMIVIMICRFKVDVCICINVIDRL